MIKVTPLSEREKAMFEALQKIEGICDNAIAPYDDSADSKLDRIWAILMEPSVLSALIDMADELDERGER